MIVDVHVHVAPPEFLTAIGRIGEVRPAPSGGGVHVALQGAAVPLGPPFLEPEVLTARLDQLGIDVAVVSVVPLLLGYRLPAAAAGDLAVAANLGLASFAAAAPRRLRWLAHVPLQDVGAAVVVLEQAMASGSLGVQIGTHVAGRNLDSPELQPFFARAAELGAFVLVHAADCLAPERMERHYASNIVGNPFEAGLAVASTIFGRVHEQARPLNICFCHGGGAAPALAARWDRAWAIGRLDGTRLDAAPSAAFRALWFDSLCYGEEQLKLLVSLAGADRVLLGSDQPFPIAEPDPVGRIRRLDWLGEADRQAILGGSAAALFGLEAP